jgi:hypothetical protein
MSVGPATDAMKPDFERVRTHSEPGFMALRLTRGPQAAVPVLRESGSRGSVSGSDNKLNGIA